MSDLPFHHDVNDICKLCSHPYSIHFSNDIHGIGSKDLTDVSSGCTFIDSFGIQCKCVGFRSSILRYEE